MKWINEYWVFGIDDLPPMVRKPLVKTQRFENFKPNANIKISSALLVTHPEIFNSNPRLDLRKSPLQRKLPHVE